MTTTTTTAVDRLLDAIDGTRSRTDVGDVFAADALFDAIVPDWRFPRARRPGDRLPAGRVVPAPRPARGGRAARHADRRGRQLHRHLGGGRRPARRAPGPRARPSSTTASPATTCGAAAGGRQPCSRQMEAAGMMADVHAARRSTPRPRAVVGRRAARRRRRTASRSSQRLEVGLGRSSGSSSTASRTSSSTSTSTTTGRCGSTATSAASRAQVWAAGLMDVLPERIDHGVVGVAGGLGRNGWGAAILMRDLSASWCRPATTRSPLEQHLALPRRHGRAGGPHVGLARRHRARAARATGGRGSATRPRRSSAERGWPDAVPRIAADGWERFAERAPRDVVDAIDDAATRPGAARRRACATTPLCVRARRLEARQPRHRAPTAAPC